MKIYCFLFLVLCLLSCQSNISEKSVNDNDLSNYNSAVLVETQDSQKSMSLIDIIPPGYTIVQTNEGPDQVEGDLNGDGIKDMAVLIEMRGDESYDQAEEVLLLIYSGDRHRQLQFAAATENLGGASVAYSDTKKLSLKKNILGYHHQSMRHEIDIKIRYDKHKTEYFLIGKEFQEFGGIEEGPTKISINYVTGVKLIDESVWNDDIEEVVSLPQKKESVSKKRIDINQINWDKLYDDI